MLQIVADTLCTEIQQLQRSGEVQDLLLQGRRETSDKTPAGLLATDCEWQLHVNLRKLLEFPEHITKKPLKPDTVLTLDWSLHCLGKSGWRRPMNKRKPDTFNEFDNLGLGYIEMLLH